MPPLAETYHKLEVYRSRLLALKQDPCGKSTDIWFYEDAIIHLEAEIAVTELLEELQPPKPWSVTTDCWQTVLLLCQEESVIHMKMKWSWREFKFLWYVQYLTSKPNRKCCS